MVKLQLGKVSTMDGLRFRWDLDITRVGFHEYGEPVFQPTPHSMLQSTPKEVTRSEVIKTYSLYNENNRSGTRSRHRAVVAVGNDSGKIGLGSKIHRDRKVAIQKARELAEQSQVNIPLGCHPSTPGENQTVQRELTGLHGDLTIRIVPTARGTGINASPMAIVFLKLAGIKDCDVFPEASRLDNTPSMAFALYNAVRCECQGDGQT